MLKCELTDLPVGSQFGAGGSTGISSTSASLLQDIRIRSPAARRYSVVYMLTTTTDLVISVDLLSVRVVNSVAAELEIY